MTLLVVIGGNIMKFVISTNILLEPTLYYTIANELIDHKKSNMCLIVFIVIIVKCRERLAVIIKFKSL